MQYHPDMNKGPGAEEKFKEIAAAYEASYIATVLYYCGQILLSETFLCLCKKRHSFMKV